MRLLDLRALPLRLHVALIALVSVVLGLVAYPIARSHRPRGEKARLLAGEKNYGAAEDEYLELAAETPEDVSLLLELLSNHQKLRIQDAEIANEEAERERRHQGMPVRRARNDVAARDARIDELFAHLPAESTLIAGYWYDVLDGGATDEEDESIAEAASTTPPTRWANHVLGLAAERAGGHALAATFFAREARAFPESRADADRAYWLWMSGGDSAALNEALEDPRFANLLGSGVHFDMADRRGELRQAMRTYLRSLYADASTGSLLLALLSASAWFTFCIAIGGGRQSERRILVLYGICFVLGIASTYLTIALLLLERQVLPFLRSTSDGPNVADLLIGVGPREELAKTLVSFVPILLAKHAGGGRREAIACGAMVGLGFAAEENIGYFASGLGTALLRFLTANFFHIAMTGTIAVAIDDALRGKVSKGDGVGWTLGFMIVMHGLYDLFVVGGERDGRLALVALVIFFLVSKRFLRPLRELPVAPASLLPIFYVGMTLVTGASFVYASVLVGPLHAARAMAIALIGMVVVIVKFTSDLTHDD